jgi:hypothetical protein
MLSSGLSLRPTCIVAKTERISQDRCRRQALDQPSERARLVPAMEHDGRDLHHERGQGGVLLRDLGPEGRP